MSNLWDIRLDANDGTLDCRTSDEYEEETEHVEYMNSDDGSVLLMIRWEDDLPRVISVNISDKAKVQVIQTWIEEAVRQAIDPRYEDDYWM